MLPENFNLSTCSRGHLTNLFCDLTVTFILELNTYFLDKEKYIIYGFKYPGHTNGDHILDHQISTWLKSRTFGNVYTHLYYLDCFVYVY